MSLISSAARFWANRRLRGFDETNPQATLKTLLKQARDTRFGKDFDFAGILVAADTYATFSEKVPVIDYDDWVSWLGDLSPLNGAKPLVDVSWPGRVDIFCLSSGTTSGRTKYVPYSKQMAAINRKAALDFLAAMLRYAPEIAPLKAKACYMTGSTQLEREPSGALCGDMSALTKFLAPGFLEWFTLPPRSISDLEPWSRRLEALVELFLNEPKIGSLSGIPIWQLTLLEAIQAQTGELPGDVLPNLKFLVHGGMSMAPYREPIRELLPAVQFLEVYAASETGIAAFGIPGEQGMRFCEGYQVFYEFEAPDGSIITSRDIVPGEKYALIVSSCSGLWRYRIGDILVFASKDPLVLDYVTRDKTTSAFDEKVTEKELETAMAASERPVADFSLGPDLEGRRHVWFLMSDFMPNADEIEALDQRLRAGNQDYDDYRGDGRINAPMVVAVENRGVFLELLGREEGGQRKFPRLLSPDETRRALNHYIPSLSEK